MLSSGDVSQEVLKRTHGPYLEVKTVTSCRRIMQCAQYLEISKGDLGFGFAKVSSADFLLAKVEHRSLFGVSIQLRSFLYRTRFEIV